MSSFSFPVNFREGAHSALQDRHLQATLKEVMPHFREKRNKIVSEIDDWEERRERASQVKEELLERWEELHRQADESLRDNGIRVFHAKDAREARDIVGAIAREKGIKKVVKSKSMVTEEIELNPYLEGLGIEVTETDLGEFIVQLAGERPFHIVAPALHKKAKDVALLFRKMLGSVVKEEIKELTDVARNTLREKFLRAEMGITGANFVAADNGTIVIVENEGNASLTVTLPKVHVAIIGEEKLLPRFRDLGLFLPLLTISATGQRLTSYALLLKGPSTGINDGRERYVIFLDNGRTKLLADAELRAILKCIRCAACLNVCPVYNKVGGYPYGWVYSGPVGAVFNFGILGPQRAGELPFASTLCGACDEVCPLKIPLSRLLVMERRRMREGEAAKVPPRPGFFERSLFSLWSLIMSRSSLYRLGDGFMRKVLRIGLGRWKRHRLPPLKRWCKGRDFPPLAEKSFLSGWRKK